MMSGDSGVKGLECKVTHAYSPGPDCPRGYFNKLWVKGWRAPKRPGRRVAVHQSDTRSWGLKPAPPPGT